MSLTVGSLLEGAYTRSSLNDPGKLASDPECVAHLNRVYQRTWALLARARPDQFGSAVARTLTSIPAGATLPADVIDVVAVFTAAGVPVALIPRAEAARTWHLAPAVYREGLRLVSRNQAGDPGSGAVLTVIVLDAPAALTGRASVLDTRWPVRHAQLLVDLLAVYLSTKDAGRAATEHEKILAEAKGNAAALAAEFGLPPAAVEWMHAPAERAEPKA